MNNLIPLTDEERATRRQVAAVLNILDIHLREAIQRERAEGTGNPDIISALQSVRIAVLDTVVSTSILNLSSPDHVPTPN